MVARLAIGIEATSLVGVGVGARVTTEGVLGRRGTEVVGRGRRAGNVVRGVVDVAVMGRERNSLEEIVVVGGMLGEKGPATTDL